MISSIVPCAKHPGSGRFLLLAISAFFLLPIHRASAAPASQSAAATAFVHVNVVPMDKEHVLKDQIVLVEGSKITAIGPHLRLPAGAKIIDGHGTAYLSPGLADMHVHSDTPDDLIVYLANGVTTVLTMGGGRASFIDKIVPAANSGRIPGPHVYTSFLVDGSTDYNGFIVKTRSEGEAIVGLAKTNGYDFIKVYNDLSPEAFGGIIDAGKRLGLPVVGHGLTRLGLEKQLAAGQVLVAHAEEYFYTYFTPPGARQTDVPPALDRIPEAIRMTRGYGAAVTADLGNYGTIARQIGHKKVVDAFLSRPETRYLSPNDRLRWRRDTYVDKTADLSRKYVFLQKFLKALADSGVPLVTGTDAPAVPGDLPGYSLHEDLAALEGAGLTRFQILSAATRQPGEFIARTIGGERFGTVTVGSRADLVLTRLNPLDNLATLSEPLGVMAYGGWHDRMELRSLLDQVASRYDEAAARRPLPPAQ